VRSAWASLAAQITRRFEKSASLQALATLPVVDIARLRTEFLENYLPERLDIFRQRLHERALISDELMRKAAADGEWLSARLEGELMKDSLVRRQAAFQRRTYDRTVHPTQRYSLQAEMVVDSIQRALIDRTDSRVRAGRKSCRRTLARVSGPERQHQLCARSR
jgi:hypothetical protein